MVPWRFFQAEYSNFIEPMKPILNPWMSQLENALFGLGEMQLASTWGSLSRKFCWLKEGLLAVMIYFSNG